MDFVDTTVVITGAGHGIGLATTKHFAERGAKLVLGDLNPETLADAAAEAEKLGAEVRAVPFDQRVSADGERLVATAVEAFGRIDVLATIAGIYPFAAVADATDELWADVLGTNLTGPPCPGWWPRARARSSPSPRGRPRSPTPAPWPTPPPRAASRP
jgi:NAD(P)-dependent dehydrogenase (short-subunit alcohol dehydrogenase family)